MLILMSFILMVKGSDFSLDDSETGQVCQLGTYPFIAALLDEDSHKHICGAAIVSQMFVVTSCHCIKKPTLKKHTYRVKLEDVIVVAGAMTTQDNQGVVRNAEIGFFHEKCDYENPKEFVDVAGIKVNYPFRYSNRLQALNVRPKKKQSDFMLDYKNMISGKIKCHYVAWSFLQRNFPSLKYKHNRVLVRIHVLPVKGSECRKKVCQEYLSLSLTKRCSILVNKGELCFKKNTSEPSRLFDVHEEGGFLMCEDYIYGFRKCAEYSSCVLTRSPLIFTFVSSFHEFFVTISFAFSQQHHLTIFLLHMAFLI